METCLLQSVGLRAISSTWQRPTAPCQGGPAQGRDCGGVRAPLTRCGSPSGGRRDSAKAHQRPQRCFGPAIPETAGLRGGERPRLAPLNPSVRFGVRIVVAWLIAATHPRVLLPSARPSPSTVRNSWSWSSPPLLNRGDLLKPLVSVLERIHEEMPPSNEEPQLASADGPNSASLAGE